MRRLFALILAFACLFTIPSISLAEETTSLKIGQPVIIHTSEGDYTFQIDNVHVTDWDYFNKPGYFQITVQGVVENNQIESYGFGVTSNDVGERALLVKDQDGFALEFHDVSGLEDGLYEVCGDTKIGSKKRISLPYYAPESTTSISISINGYNELVFPLKDENVVILDENLFNESDEIKRLNTLITKKNNDINQLESQIVDLNTSIESFKTQIEKLESDNSEKDLQIRDLTNQLVDKESQIESLMEQLADTEKRSEETPTKVDPESSTESVISDLSQYEVLEKGSRNSQEVTKLQKRLIQLNYLTLWDADGDFGQKTANAVSAFQHEAGLPETGVADKVTQSKLYENNAPRAKQYEQLDYKEFSRDPDAYLDMRIQFSGRVAQVYENGGEETIYRITSKGNYDDMVYCTYKTPENFKRIIEDDKVIVYGIFKGLYTYSSIFGAKITIPHCEIERVELRPY